MFNTILFDLDGTLLPMDQNAFMKAYFSYMSVRLAPHGYDAGDLIKGIWAGTSAMMKNTGECSNERVFWKTFAGIFGEKAYHDEPFFAEFYRTDFQKIKDVCGYTPKAKWIIDKLKEHGYRIILATNPLFPAIATESRIRWAGMDPKDFELYTTYENSCHCKPNPAYYQDILNSIGCAAEDCLMVGNDVDEDMVAAGLGMDVFLLTDCLINRTDADISVYPHGGFEELDHYIFNR